jgi:hypothetical protein
MSSVMFVAIGVSRRFVLIDRVTDVSDESNLDPKVYPAA